MQKRSLRISIFATPLMIVGGLLASSVQAGAQSPNATGCSNRILSGNYGFSIEGEILAGAVTLPLRGVAMTHFDGNGNLTQVDHVLVNGAPPPSEWTPGSGTYTVNPNCTGTAQINIPGNPLSPLNLHFVVVRQGREIHTVVEANAVSSVGIKVD
jgi:hypothetical protein